LKKCRLHKKVLLTIPPMPLPFVLASLRSLLSRQVLVPGISVDFPVGSVVRGTDGISRVPTV